MSKQRVLGLKPQLRLEWRGQNGQSETAQPDHPANLGDSVTSSTRIRFSVHTTRRLRRIRYLSNLQHTAWEQSVLDHEAMLKALTARDAATTRRIMTDHAADIWATVQTTLE